MIKALLPADYAQDAGIRAAYQTWLNDPMTRDVLQTLEVMSRAHMHVPQDTTAGSLALAFGKAAGKQELLDTIRSLDVSRAYDAPVEEFRTGPVPEDVRNTDK